MGAEWKRIRAFGLLWRANSLSKFGWVEKKFYYLQEPCVCPVMFAITRLSFIHTHIFSQCHSTLLVWNLWFHAVFRSLDNFLKLHLSGVIIWSGSWNSGVTMWKPKRSGAFFLKRTQTSKGCCGWRMDNCYASVLSTQPGWNPQLLAVSALILLSKHILKSIEMFENPIQEHHFLCL